MNMLTENPKLGQVVRATQDVYSDENEEYLIKDQWYEVAGVDENPYHIDETGGRCYIDEAAWHLYELTDTHIEYEKDTSEHLIDALDKWMDEKISSALDEFKKEIRLWVNS